MTIKMGGKILYMSPFQWIEERSRMSQITFIFSQGPIEGIPSSGIDQGSQRNKADGPDHIHPVDTKSKPKIIANPWTAIRQCRLRACDEKLLEDLFLDEEMRSRFVAEANLIILTGKSPQDALKRLVWEYIGYAKDELHIKKRKGGTSDMLLRREYLLKRSGRARQKLKELDPR